MGWNDHLPDPEAWESFVEQQFLKADRDRKRAREDGPLFRPPPVEKPEEDE